jgi:hypothetical protein
LGRARRQGAAGILSLNAAPIDVADYLRRRRLFESDTSIIMTSATLATEREKGDRPNPKAATHRQTKARASADKTAATPA